VILVIGIGGLVIFQVGTFTLSAMALATVLGIIIELSSYQKLQEAKKTRRNRILMIIQSERISLKHLLTIEALTDQEVMGLIRRAQEFKNGAQWTPQRRQYFATNLFLKIAHVHIKALK
jgi:ABC-type dipeptide/oligopeptide/nickel transport system ATPase component